MDTSEGTGQALDATVVTTETSPEETIVEAPEGPSIEELTRIRDSAAAKVAKLEAHLASAREVLAAAEAALA